MLIKTLVRAPAYYLHRGSEGCAGQEAGDAGEDHVRQTQSVRKPVGQETCMWWRHNHSGGTVL
jgi:hypothetical protein